MSFIPVCGTAVFRAGDPPREGVVEFTDTRRTVALPMRAALPVLAKAHVRADLHPSVALLSGAVLLGMRLVAAGRFEPALDPAGGSSSWRVAPLSGEEDDRVRMLSHARAYDDLDPVSAEALVRRVLEAVVDAMPRSAPVPLGAPSPRIRVGPDGEVVGGVVGGRVGVSDRRPFAERLADRIERHRTAPPATLTQLVGISLRIEADEEELVAGSVRLVLQVQDPHDPVKVCDAARLWDESGASATHGFGDRARTHAVIALRGAAEAWPALDRLLEQPVPDQLTLAREEVFSLLEHGVSALKDRDIEVLWPRSLGRDLTSQAVLETARETPPGERGRREAPLNEPTMGLDTLFSFRWQVALHGEALCEAEMKALAEATAPVLKLRGGWSVIHPEVARRAKQRLIRSVGPGEALAVALTQTAEIEQTQEQVVVGASLLKVRDRLAALPMRRPVDVPAGLRATLRDYQREGLTWLAEMTALGLGGCLADDMGLGKTVQLIALHLHRAESGHLAPTLVVCPASLLGNWAAEIGRFAPGVSVRRFHGGQRSLDGLLPDRSDGGQGPGFVLTTYGTLRRNHARFGEVAWGLVVADEAQHVKNAHSSTAKALREVPAQARVALTGTPVENDLTELWSILDWVIPGLLGSRQAFRRVWAAPIESGKEPTKAKQFATLVEPFLLRRRKSDPGIAPELPAKTETDHLLSLTKEQVVLYEAFVRETMKRIEDLKDPMHRRGLVLALLTGLKQICNHPAHFLKQSGARLEGRSEKLDLLDVLLETVLAEGGAALVFTQYVAMARLLEEHLSRARISHQLLHGGTPVREREAMVARFQASPDGQAPVFLLSLKAGGTGLNLTRADHVVHVDRWWNPAVEEQATDRAYRIGQTRPVQVHRMIMRGTLEERIGELLTRKQALADSVLGRGEAALTELSNADLRDLVTLRPDR